MDTLVAAAIHDAKNGLTALNTWLAEAERQHPSPAIHEARNVAGRVANQLVELLALYRENEGSLRLAIDDHDLTDFCTDLIAELGRPTSESLQVESDFSAAGELGAWAFDDYQVKLVLLDALRNGMRHATSTVRCRLEALPDGIGFTVEDDGPGFPAAVLAGGDGTMHGEGSGLGLRFARLIAMRHATPNGRHGHIDLCNPPEGGAEFRLVLP